MKEGEREQNEREKRTEAVRAGRNGKGRGREKDTYGERLRRRNGRGGRRGSLSPSLRKQQSYKLTLEEVSWREEEGDGAKEEKRW